MVEISWIGDKIAVSGAISDEDISRLKNAGIDAIIDVRTCYSKVPLEKPPGVIIDRVAMAFTKIDRQEEDMIGEFAERFYLKKAIHIEP